MVKGVGISLRGFAYFAFLSIASLAHLATVATGSPSGFYEFLDTTRFYRLAKHHGTDKWNYAEMYSKYFEFLPGSRQRISKVWEIGLGCTMSYGPGASAKLWRQYFGHAEIWFSEYNSDCVAKHKAHLSHLGVNIVTGDQSDTATLRRWISETKGDFDVIIDDGGHTNMQQYSSFVTLFVHALRPGGIYFIEDLAVSRSNEYVDGDQQHITIEVIKDWIEGVVMSPDHEPIPGKGYTPKFKLPPRVKSIDCLRSICAFVKCYESDARCDTRAVNASLSSYQQVGTGLMTGGK